ncbi:N-6 DNA methylase [Acinetobacter baumannii]|uniref:N-6 DNA methylase n=1 Tax=Acinetobacter baumannii TaxID=470 RepID=UPI00028CE614|nr:N-6 DNA methylase [Acinetobacter baumannii]EHU1441309.1 N-6 DNA methylase [Acinetobacter baumannii]EHU1809129.1 N-6 DNA methylase [Acinetobacter baumannii]EHU2698517.1 N-6 DNA methylase [Acinetobacter baumannii]EKL59623.1 N-6 DNA Methylase [Acinetobacter baumannii OIFC110]MDC5288110.1 N-6 DNA methylase [Acinetobacter baumannii]
MFKIDTQVSIPSDQNYFTQSHIRKHTDILGRYYTPIAIAKIMCEVTGKFQNKSVIDLGCGTGNLIEGALHVWKECNFHAFDVDFNALEILLNKGKPNVSIFQLDIINSTNFKLKYQVGISNPPYTYYERNNILYLDNQSPLDEELLKLKKIPAPFLFLRHLTTCIQKDGYISIILPNGLLSNKLYSGIREILIKNYTILKVISLQKKTFEKTETNAHILILKLKKPKNSYSIQYFSLKDMKLNEGFLRKSTNCIERLDFQYQQNCFSKDSSKISDFIDNIYRGNIHSKAIKSENLNIFHSTDFTKDSVEIPSKFYKSTNLNYKFAESGDILIARVGRNFFKKIALVKNGNIYISDCIIVLKPKKGFSKYLLDYLRSKNGQFFLENISHGTGAKHINFKQLINIPIIKE